jgi:hypothetical protein
MGVPTATGDRNPSGVRRIHGVVWLRPIRSVQQGAARIDDSPLTGEAWAG